MLAVSENEPWQILKDDRCRRDVDYYGLNDNPTSEFGRMIFYRDNTLFYTGKMFTKSMHLSKGFYIDSNKDLVSLHINWIGKQENDDGKYFIKIKNKDYQDILWMHHAETISPLDKFYELDKQKWLYVYYSRLDVRIAYVTLTGKLAAILNKIEQISDSFVDDMVSAEYVRYSNNELKVLIGKQESLQDLGFDSTGQEKNNIDELQKIALSTSKKRKIETVEKYIKLFEDMMLEF